MNNTLDASTWDKDELCIKAVSDLLSMLPKLKASGAIRSFLITDSVIRIELSTDTGKTRPKRFWQRKE